MNTSKGSGRSGRQTRRPKTIDLKADDTSKENADKKSDATKAPAATSKASSPTGPKVKSSAEKLPPQPEQPVASKTAVSQQESSARKDDAGKAATAPGVSGAGDSPVKQGSGDVGDVKEKRSLASLFMAGAAGGVVALGIGAVAVGGGLLRSDSDPAADSRVAELQSTLESLNDRVAGLEGSQQEGGGEALQAVTSRVEDLETRIGELQESFAGLSQAAQESDGDPDFATALNNSLMEDFEQRIAAAEQSIQELRSGSSQEGGQAGEQENDFAAELNRSLMEDFENRMVAAEQAIQQVQSGESNSDAADGVENNSQQITALAERADALESQIGEIEAGLQTLRDQREARSESEDRIARSVAANALRTAYERGEPFASLLASVQALTGELDEAAALEDQAHTGVATITELREQLSAIAAEVIHSATPSEDGMVAQLLSNAKSLVRVRPAGPLPGDSPEAIVSRIEDRLEKSDVAGALEEWETLPESARQISQEWAARVRERLEADGRLDAILAALQSGGDAGQPVQTE